MAPAKRNWERIFPRPSRVVEKSVERERELLGVWTGWKSGEREKRSFLGELSFVEAGERSFLEAGERVAGGKGPSPGRREPAGLRASLRHEQARGTSSEAVTLRGDASQGSRNSHFLFSFQGFV